MLDFISLYLFFTSKCNEQLYITASVAGDAGCSPFALINQQRFTPSAVS